MTLLQDLRYGARLMLGKPALAAISVLTLSLGIGLTAMMFSIVNGAILKGLPFEGADRLMSVVRTDLTRGSDNMGVSLHELEDWRDQQQVFESLAAYGTGTFNVSGTEGAERYDGGLMSVNAFDVLRVRPILGRSFREGEDSPETPLVTLIGYRVWQDRFGGDPQVLGRTLRVNGMEATIVGVMEDGFMFPETELIWLPERRSANDYARGDAAVPFKDVYGRLRDGVTLDQANAQLSAIAQRLATTYPQTNENIGVRVQPFQHRFIGKEPRKMLFVMLGAVFGVLLIACANVANLLLTQAALRAKEVGIRTALGASRIRIVVQFLTEPLVLATVGAIFGLGIAWVGIRVFDNAIAATNPPFWLKFGIDGNVLLFVLGITLFSTIVSGVLPAIRASGGNVADILKDDSRGASSFRGGRLTRVLVIAEIAISVVLLVGAGLMIRSVTRLANVDFGFPTEDVFTVRFGLPEADARYADVERRIQFFEAVQTRLAGETGVRSVTLASSLPVFYGTNHQLAIEGRTYERPQDHPSSRSSIITPSFFETFGVGLAQGRAFGAQDREGSLPVAIVNQSFVAKHFPDGNVVGSRFRVGAADSDRPWLTIVGIAPDMYMSGAENEQPDGFYIPLAQDRGVRFMSLAIKATGPPHALTPRIREAIAAVDAEIPFYWPRTLAEGIASENWFFRVFGAIFMLMGFVALFLAAIGLYGVMSFSVSRRTREMGVRLALGAHAGDVIALVMRQGVVQLGIGLVIGLAGAWAVSTVLTGFLFGISPRDPITFALTVTVLLSTGLIATWVPARRATRVDPLVALRYD